jgi:3D (Asp-Asp-Asp) domain-containing protein
LIFPARTSSAETLSSVALDIPSIPSKGTVGEKIAVEEAYVVPPKSYVATAYSLRGRTASGRMVSKGLIAADPRHLPLGSRVRIEAGTYSGEYLVADTGGMVRGRRIDIWTPTSREAMRFGRRMVKLTVLSLGRKK